MITQSELKKIFLYEKESGIFTRKRLNKITGSKNNCGYLNININNKTYYAHRLAWLYVYGEFPKHIDHINHIRTDNRIANLRNVEHKENRRNSSLISTNKSGVNGVFWDKRTKNGLLVSLCETTEDVKIST